MERQRNGRIRVPGAAAVLVSALALLAPTLPVRAQDPGEVSTTLVTEDPRIRGLWEEIRGTLDANGWRGAQWSVLAVSATSGDTLFARQPTWPLAPASNIKLLTSAAALHYLGPDFRFRTFVVADGPVRNGVLEGDLVLYGTGDPTLSDRLFETRTLVLESLADQVRAAGIQRVEGRVLGDATHFDAAYLGPGWDPDDLDDSFSAPVAALSFNENVVSIRVEPTSPGLPPRIHTLPAGADVPIQNRARTVSGPARPRLRIGRDSVSAPIRVEGEIRAGGREVWRQLTVFDPPRYAAAVFTTVLEERGVAVGGGAGTIPPGTRSPITGRRVVAPVLGPETAVRIVAEHRSPPLSDLLAVVNKKSHNLYAEMVLKTLGRQVAGEAGFDGGVRAVRRFLVEQVGLEPHAVEQVDGSGLSPRNRASAAAFVRVLEHMHHSPLAPAFRATLPEAGNRRELARMYRTAAAGNLRAKTGTLSRVSALSGEVQAANGERILFSILANDVPSTWVAKRIEDQIGVRLATFDRPLGSTAAASRVAASGAEDATPPGPGSREDPGTHRVARGESFTSIARRYSLPLDALLTANPGIPPEELQAGQVLTIPVAGQR